MAAIDDVITNTANELNHTKSDVAEVIASVAGLAKKIIENKQAPGIRLPFVGIFEFSEARAKHRENDKSKNN